ncbi:MAG: PIN domain nuclease [Thermoplasmata archaeon]|nr:MAG: PIN domain nuclease [Thermoplasmata archaeon]
MKALIDTNVLVYDTFEDGIYHKEAQKILDNLKEWIIPTIVLHEYVWFMKSINMSIEDCIEKVKEYIYDEKSKILCETQNDVIGSLRIISKERLSLSSYNDKVLLYLAKRYRLAIATFDEKLKKQAKKENLKVIQY